MRKAGIVYLMFMAIMMNAAFAQKPAVVVSTEPGWHKIGEVTASFKMQDESIAVWGADRFSALKLKVTDAPIHIERMQVFFEDGEVQDVDVKDDLQAGSETRVIDLSAKDKEIKKVSFAYQTASNYSGDKAHLELYGLKTGEDTNSNAYRKDAENKADSTGDAWNNKADRAGDKARQDAGEAKGEMKKDANKVGNDISEAAGNVGADIKDKPYVDKVGPNGERIYMDRHSNYYYINETGKKVSITKAEMKDNPKKDK
jgi:hypothetical protein